MRILTLKNGKTLKCSLCGEQLGVLWIIITEEGYSVLQAAKDFTPENAETIVWDSGSGIEVSFVGYSRLITISQDSISVTIGLMKGDS